MVAWNNLDTVAAFKELEKCGKIVNLPEVMSGEDGAKRAKEYSVPMAAGLAYNYASKQVDDDIIDKLAALTDEMQLLDKMIHYCNTSSCLRRELLEYFGEKAPLRCHNCGNCTSTSKASWRKYFGI